MINYYRLPIMSISDFLVEIASNSNYKALKTFCREEISEGETFHIKITLGGRRWYPEVVTSDRWLAWKLIQKYGGK